jgi:hypothetical protein
VREGKCSERGSAKGEESEFRAGSSSSSSGSASGRSEVGQKNRPRLDLLVKWEGSVEGEFSSAEEGVEDVGVE